MIEPMTLFDFVARVARLREAQRRAETLASEYNLRQVVPLAHEIDGLIREAQQLRLYPDFLTFVERVTAMRHTQGAFSTSSESVRRDWESLVDREVERLTLEAKALGEQLREHNAQFSVTVTANNGARRRGLR